MSFFLFSLSNDQPQPSSLPATLACLLEKMDRTYLFLLSLSLQKVQWSSLVCNNPGSPKWIFILRLAALKRLHTRDRLVKWGVTEDHQCTLCPSGSETTDHLFFSCPYASEIWSKMLLWLGVTRKVMPWQEEIEWACVNAKGRGTLATLYRMCLAAAVYQVWIERNRRIFQAKSSPSQVIIRKIVQDIFVRSSRNPRLARRLELNFYP